MEKIFNKKNSINIIKGSIVSVIITCILLLVLACILTYTNTSERMIEPAMMIILGMSVIMGSIISTKYIKRNGFLNGALVGIMYVANIYIISSIYTSSITVSGKLINVLLLSIFVGILGGIVGVNINKK